MSSLDEVDSGAAVYGPARVIGWVVLALMLVTVVYAVFIGLRNWSSIGV